MKNDFGRPAWILAFLSLSLAPAAVSGAAPEATGTASGQLTVAGTTTPLHYAYARAGKSFFDPGKEDILIILSDVAIPETALEDVFERHHMAAEGKLHAVEVSVNSDRQPVSGGLLHEAFADSQGYVSVTGMHRFEARTFDADLVEGKLSMGKPDEFMNRKFEYSATFRAPVWRRPAPTASGAAAAETPPGQATLAFLSAARSGDKAAIRKIMTADAGKELDGPHGKEMLEFLKATAPNPATARIDTVDIHGDAAQVAVIEKSRDGSVTSNFKLVLEDGVWKVSGM